MHNRLRCLGTVVCSGSCMESLGYRRGGVLFVPCWYLPVPCEDRRLVAWTEVSARCSGYLPVTLKDRRLEVWM